MCGRLLTWNFKYELLKSPLKMFYLSATQLIVQKCINACEANGVFEESQRSSEPQQRSNAADKNK